MTAEIIHVSTNFACPTEIRELGEAHAVIVVADQAQRQFEKCLELLRTSSNECIRETAQRAFEMLGDLRHDASWNTLVTRAADAMGEARVVKMRRL